MEEKNDIINIVCFNDKKLVISINELNIQVKERGSEIPRILKRFLGIDMAGFKQKNQNSNLLFAKEYGITIEGMAEIIKFLKFGIVEDDDDDNYNFLFEMFTRIGGCPEFDKYYNNYLQNKKIKEEEKNNSYNPQNPTDDYLNKFDWKILAVNLHDNLEKFEGWSVCDKVYLETNKFYFRKLKIEN